MARTFLTFGDIEGKLDVLRVECEMRPQGPLSRPKANRKMWPDASMSERSMTSAEQPTDSDANQEGSVGLLFDRLPQGPLERTCCLCQSIGGAVGDLRGTIASLPIDIPRCSLDLLGNAFRPLLRIAQCAIQIIGHITLR
jgi:hypothetical protein